VITKRSKKKKEYMQSEREQNIERIENEDKKSTQIQRKRDKCKIYERKEFLCSFPRRRDI